MTLRRFAVEDALCLVLGWVFAVAWCLTLSGLAVDVALCLVLGVSGCSVLDLERARIGMALCSGA